MDPLVAALGLPGHVPTAHNARSLTAVIASTSMSPEARFLITASTYPLHGALLKRINVDPEDLRKRQQDYLRGHT